MKHFRYLICVILYLHFVMSLSAEMLSVSRDLMKLTVSDIDGSFILFSRSDPTVDWLPLLWEDKYPTSNIRIWLDNRLVPWESTANHARHSADVTNDTIVLSRSDDYADMQLAFALRHSDNAFKANSLLITVSICPQTTRRDRMFRRRDFAAPNDHRGVVRICYDTYLGETTGRHFTYFSQGYSQNVMLTDNAVNDYSIEHSIEPSIEPSNDLTNDVTGDEIVSADRTGDVASDNSADIAAVAAVTNNIVKNEVKKEDKTVSIWQRIFGRQRPKHDFDELPGTKMIDHECEFFRFAVPFVMSGERPNSPTLYLWTKGAWLTEPTRIFFANWKSGNTEGIYRVRDGAAFGQFPYQREDSAAFFEYVIPNMKDDEAIDITAGVSIVPNITFSQSRLEIQPDVSDDVIVSDVTSDSEMDRLLNGINNQLNSKNDVRQSGVDRTQNMLDEIKKR